MKEAKIQISVKIPKCLYRESLKRKWDIEEIISESMTKKMISEDLKKS